MASSVPRFLLFAECEFCSRSVVHTRQWHNTNKLLADNDFTEASIVLVDILFTREGKKKGNAIVPTLWIHNLILISY